MPSSASSFSTRAAQLLVRPDVRVAQIEAALQLARNDVRRAGVAVHVDHLKRRRRKVLVAGVDRLARHRCDEPGERVDRVVDLERIGDVPLHAADRHDAGQAAAAADLDRVAELRRARRLADDAVLKRLAAPRQRLHHLQRAVVGRAFLVARDQEADRARELRMPLGEPAAGVDHRCEAAFHVGRAAADQPVAPDRGGERVDVPLLGRPRRDDVGVAREDERRSRAAAACPKIVDLAEPETLDDEAGGLEQLADQDLAARVGRRNRGPADQLARKAQRVHWSGISRFFMVLAGARWCPWRNGTERRLQ